MGSDGNGQPQVIRYLDEIEGFVPWTWLRHQDVGHTDGAKKELSEIMGEPVATTPKPTKLLRHLLQIYTNPEDNDIILDSFAGSGTTAHAVLQLNAADDGNRRFVIVQQPYDTKEDESHATNICRSLTAKRVTRAIKGYPFNGIKRHVLLEENVTLSTLRSASELIDRIDRTKSEGETRFDQVTVSCNNGVVKVVGMDRITEKAPGLGGTFSYARLGEPLLGEYKDFGDELPSYEDLAKYVFYTETSREFPGANKRRNPAWDKRAGRIGEHAGRSYYLLYESTEGRGRGLNRAFLSDVASRDPNADLVVYCERLAVHQDELRKFRREYGKRIRHMLVPFQLK